MTGSKRVPRYTHHKPSGQARVRIAGRDHYLGPFGSPQSREKYARLIAESAANAAQIGQLAPVGTFRDLLINELIVFYWDFAKGYYVRDGRPTKELACMKDALRPLRKLYGESMVAEFGPRALKAVRQHMVDVEKLSRGVINHRVNRIRRVFRWAVSEELIPVSIYEALRTVSGLKFGRTNARETPPVSPANDSDVEALVKFLSPTLATMVRLQRLTGMRPGEVVQMRLCDIDRTQPIWLYEPAEHKNQWRDHQRLVPLGPQAQAILQPFLDRPAEAFLFSPREAEQWRREQLSQQAGKDRKTRIYPCELRARERRRQERKRRRRKRELRDQYDTASYRRAIEYAYDRAKKAGIEVKHWHPHQLRHTRATEVRREHGIEAAQVVLGHARADVTQIYAERNLALAVDVARSSG